MSRKLSGAQIRQEFIEFFAKHNHKFVPSSSLVPGGDATLLFTNAGMVQFKEYFLGTETPSYHRATNSQKCMRVAGKHNDLEDVGRDDTHHTFFEMLGNWSFGDYYKKDAITWAWELLTEVWHLPNENLWATCFRDDVGDIPQDDEAYVEWAKQPGMIGDHILFFGRKDNFWEMAETGPCGPCSEIHLDRGLRYCDKADTPNHVCRVNGDCARFLELWNLVFIQYNRHSKDKLEPLAATHVDTGLGLDRIVSVLQDVDSNYKTDLLTPLINRVQTLTGDSDDVLNQNMTPYRVITDHARAAAFLIADGVIPGNIGRNYVCRMIIRRAARFGSKIGLDEPFLAEVAEVVIDNYGDFYPELRKNRATILNNLTREEERFQRTVESGVAKLDSLILDLQKTDHNKLSGSAAFDLYATYGLPLEITRDIAQERQMDVDEAGFHEAMKAHRLASGGGNSFTDRSDQEIGLYTNIIDHLQREGALPNGTVAYNPYGRLEVEGPLLALISNGKLVQQAKVGDEIEVLLPETCFYVEAGGQVADTGKIRSLSKPGWEISVTGMRKPAAGAIVHVGVVISGNPKTGDPVLAQVDNSRRMDIMRNHTATHLLHHELRAVLGEHARQAGSLVAPDRLRFDFTHPAPLSIKELEQIETGVNRRLFESYMLNIAIKPLQEAIDGGAIALFGEKYSEDVRNITIGDPEIFSNELCGGTHVENTADIGVFFITSESSAAAGIRRIEAITGRKAYELAKSRLMNLKQTAVVLESAIDDVSFKAEQLKQELSVSRKQIANLRTELALTEFGRQIEQVQLISGAPVLVTQFANANIDILRQIADQFRNQFSSGVALLATIENKRPLLVATVSEDLVKRGLHAGELINYAAKPLGGGGGGRPTMAQAGGKDASKLGDVLASAPRWIEEHLQD